MPKSYPANLIRWELPSLIAQVYSVCEITPDGCWLWRYGAWRDRALIDERPYPRIQIDGQRHDVAYWVLVANGQPHRKGMEPCHSCDRPPCCNPLHLRWDTHQANMAEMGAKGRSGPQRHPEQMKWSEDHKFRQHPELIPRGPRTGNYAAGDDHWTRRPEAELPWSGTAHHMARLDPGKVRAIRAAAAAGKRPVRIAEEYGVGNSTIQAILDGRTWKHVKLAAAPPSSLILKGGAYDH